MTNMKNLRKVTAILLGLILLLMLPGCWGKRELNDLAIVTGVGIDYGESERFRLTVQIYKPAKKSSGEEEAAFGKNFLNFTAAGDSFFETIREMTHKTGKELYFPHNDVIIFGWRAAEKGIQEYLDLFMRDPETRLNVWVLTAAGEAKEVLSADPGLLQLPASTMDKILRIHFAASDTVLFTLKDLAERLLSKTAAPIMPIVHISNSQDKPSLTITGTAVFKQDKLIGTLSDRETRGLLWVLNKVKGGSIDLAYPEKNASTSLKITNATSKVDISLTDNQRVKAHIRIRVSCNVGSVAQPIDLSKPHTVNALEDTLIREIEKEIKAAQDKASSLRADIFGWGEMVHKKYPSEWKTMEKEWDKIFPETTLSFDIEAKLRSTGKTINPVSPKG